MNSDEVSFYENTLYGLDQITYTSEKNIFDLLISRYVFLIIKYKLEGIALEIFDSFLIKLVKYKLKIIDISQGRESSENLAKYQRIADSLLEEIFRFIEPFPKVYYKDIKNHLLIQITMLNLSKEIINKKRDEVHKDLRNSSVHDMLRYKYMNDAFKEYLSTAN